MFGNVREMIGNVAKKCSKMFKNGNTWDTIFFRVTLAISYQNFKKPLKTKENTLILGKIYKINV